MKFKYNDIKDYFVNKNELKLYKKWDGYTQLFPQKKIYFTNKNKESVLALNVDKFKNATIIFTNSTFKSIEITENNVKNNVKIHFIGCTIEKAEFHLRGGSNILLSDCKVNVLTINNAKDVCLNNVHNLTSKPFDFICSANSIKIENSDTNLEVYNTNNIVLKNSGVFVRNIVVNNNINIFNIVMRNIQNSPINGFLKSENLNIFANSIINSCVVQANNVNIIDAIVLSNKCMFVVSSTMNIGTKSYFGDSSYNSSIINVENIHLDYNSGIDILGLTEETDFIETMNIEYNKLKEERQKLAKTLSMAKNHFKKS